MLGFLPYPVNAKHHAFAFDKPAFHGEFARKVHDSQPDQDGENALPRQHQHGNACQ